MDLLALIFSKLFSINVGMALLILDAIIIFIGILTLRDERLIYSLTIVIIVGLTATIITSIKSIKIYV
ncbi:YitT family protein [Fictibacillus sp. NRS-1165]|uniref:YitT family protein n=1 Tax=Fictibacillus sp. NRS-1165 TaxID=3144463 RepID=UPI003D21E272